MQDHHAEQLPVVETGQYVGLITEDELLEHSSADDTLEVLLPLSASPSVRGDQHFLQALSVAASQQLTVVPVLGDEKELVGLLTLSSLIQALSRLNPRSPTWSLLFSATIIRFASMPVKSSMPTSYAAITIT
jgi:CBS domain-containing protein